ncbi:MAG: MlaD family protein [Nannocystaceae bacterium]
MARKDERRLNLIVGVFVLGFGVLFMFSLVLIGMGKGTFKKKVTIDADFRSVSGLKKGSPVQLEGIEIGVVEDRTFVELDYTCSPATEDRGRFGAGRTNTCDPAMFCAPEGKCAELEAYSSNKDLHPPCDEDAQCNEDEICVTSDFRRRYRRVPWTGSNGVCASYTTEHKRIRVRLRIFEDSLEHIRDDSRAVVSQNGLLGDQLVQISIGRGAPIEDGGRIQTDPSLIEDLMSVRDRVDAMFVKVEETVGGIATLAAALGDEKTVRNVQGLIANANEVSRQIAEGKGLVGALLNDEAYVKDFGATLRSVRDTASGLDRFVARAKSSMTKIDDNLQPLVDDGRAVLANVNNMLGDLKNPNNQSLAAKLLYDPDGKMVHELEETIEGINHVVAGIEKGEGTVGKLLKDPKAYDDLIKILGNIERNNTIKRLVRFVVEKDEAASSAAPTAKTAKE